MEEVKKRPWPKRVISDKGAKQCRVAAQWLRKYGPVFNLANVETVHIQLEQYAKSLDRKYLVGTNRQEVNPDILEEWGPHDPARYQVIAFLRAYFVIAIARILARSSRSSRRQLPYRSVFRSKSTNWHTRR